MADSILNIVKAKIINIPINEDSRAMLKLFVARYRLKGYKKAIPLLINRYEAIEEIKGLIANAENEKALEILMRTIENVNKEKTVNDVH